MALLHDAGPPAPACWRPWTRWPAVPRRRTRRSSSTRGHGAFGDDGQYHLTAHDTRFVGERKRVAGGTGVSQRELLARVKALPVRRALLVFNACHAGAVSPTLAVPEAALAAAALPAGAAEALLGTGEGRVIVTACRENQASLIGGGPSTVFTQALVDALRGRGVPNRGGRISAFDLYTAVYDTVSEAVGRGTGGRRSRS